MNDLTTRQRQLLTYIVQNTFRNLYQPSFLEICDAFKVRSTNSIRCHLDALQRKGYIEFNVDAPRARAIRFTDKALDVVDIHDPLIRAIPRKRVITCPS